MHASKWNFLARLIVPTVLMGGGAWYWSTLLDARERDQNMILIQPVVMFMVLCYLAILLFEFRRYRRLVADGNIDDRPVNPADFAKPLGFMVVAIVAVVLFNLLGAILATVIAVLAGMLTLGERKPLILVATPVIATALLWLVFVEGFGMRMPLFTMF